MLALAGRCAMLTPTALHLLRQKHGEARLVGQALAAPLPLVATPFWSCGTDLVVQLR